MKEIEEQEREEELQRFRMMKLKEEVEQRLKDSLALAEKAKLEEEYKDKSLDQATKLNMNSDDEENQDYLELKDE